MKLTKIVTGVKIKKGVYVLDLTVLVNIYFRFIVTKDNLNGFKDFMMTKK